METGETHLKELLSRLDCLDREIERLKAKVEALGEQPMGREECMRRLGRLCTRTEALRTKLQETGGATEGRWGHLSEEIENIWDELKHSVSIAASKFK